MENVFQDVVIEHGDVVLRTLRPGDVADVVAACTDIETQRWLPLPHPYTDKQAREFIEAWAPRQRNTGEGLVRGVETAAASPGALT